MRERERQRDGQREREREPRKELAKILKTFSFSLSPEECVTLSMILCNGFLSD